MNKIIPTPQRGQPLRASWAASVTDACNSINAAGMVGTLVRDGAGSFGNAPLPVNQRNRRLQSKPHPFEVKWAPELKDGAGAWLFYRPTVVYKDTSLDATNAILNTYTAAGAPYPDGWYYTNSNFPTSGTFDILLVVYHNPSNNASSFALRTANDIYLDKVVACCKVATVSRNATTGDVSIIQYLVGELVLSAGGGGAETDGITGDYNVVTGVTWDSTNHRIVMTGKTFTFTNGLLTAVADISTESASVPDGFAPIETDPHYAEHTVGGSS